MDEIEKWVREQLNAGYTPEQLKESLMRIGYNPSIVDRVLSEEHPVKINKYRKILAIIFILSAFIIGAFLLSAPRPELGANKPPIRLGDLSVQLENLGVSILGPDGTEGFFVKSKSEYQISGMPVLEIEAVRGSQIMEFQDMKYPDEKTAEKYMRNKLDGVFYSYGNYTAFDAECTKKYLPAYRESENSEQKTVAVVLYTNQTFGYGVCPDYNIKYTSIISYVYCKQRKEIFSIALHTPRSEYVNKTEETVMSFACHSK